MLKEVSQEREPDFSASCLYSLKKFFVLLLRLFNQGKQEKRGGLFNTRIEAKETKITGMCVFLCSPVSVLSQSYPIAVIMSHDSLVRALFSRRNQKRN